MSLFWLFPATFLSPFTATVLPKVSDRVVTLSDYKETDFGKKYGFLIEELRLLTRGVVIIGKDNKVNYVEYVPEVTHEPNYEKHWRR